MEQKFTWPARVYYEDTDTGGVVYYANYLKFFERARTEWLRSTGISQQTLAESRNILFVVKSAALDYHAAAKLDDELKLTVVVEKLGRASIQFMQEAWRICGESEKLLATARIKVGCIDRQEFRPCVIPDDVLAQIGQKDQLITSGKKM
jgi:acyl-CoA thioester hydrolase